MTHATTATFASTEPSAAATAAPTSVEARGAVHGTPRILLRLEGLAVLTAASLAFAALGGGWGWFAGLFLVPDLSLLGYLAGSRVGAIAYNVGHSYVGPAVLAAMGGLLGAPALLLGAAIWCAHVGFDRALGYGLKYARGFGATHLGSIGRA